MNPISELIGKKVTIYSEAADTERQDIGVLQLADAGWLKMHKENGDTMYFNVARVRMVKPF